MCMCVCVHIHILKFTQNGVTMTTGSCVSAPMGEREKESDACFGAMGASEG